MLIKIIGQEKIMEDISIQLKASFLKKEPFPHTIISGPSGHGKTTISKFIAESTGSKFEYISGNEIQNRGDLEDNIMSIGKDEVIFIDEIHSLGKKEGVIEAFYIVLEEFKLNRYDIPKFTCIGATTDMSLLPQPLRDRFILKYRIKPYKEKNIVEILTNEGCDKNMARLISKRSRNIPRIAKNMLIRIQNEAITHSGGQITEEIINNMFIRNGIDEMGLDNMDRDILKYLYEKQAFLRRNAIGANTICDVMYLNQDDLKYLHEPFLISRGLLDRTSRGRILTNAGKEYVERIVKEE